MKILTPVLRVLSFTKLRFKSQKFPAAAIRKAHPAVRIPPFSVLIQSALPPIISTTTGKAKTELFRLRLTVCPFSSFQTGNAPVFKHQHRIQFPYQPIKFCLLFFLSEFGIVSGKAQPGSPGIVMESRKAAPALRARLLRSYAPLRRVRTKVSSPAQYPDSPAEIFHPQIQIFMHIHCREFLLMHSCCWYDTGLHPHYSVLPLLRRSEPFCGKQYW